MDENIELCQPYFHDLPSLYPSLLCRNYGVLAKLLHTHSEVADFICYEQFIIFYLHSCVCNMTLLLAKVPHLLEKGSL